MNNLTADLDTEVRRLRIRIIGLNPHKLDEVPGSMGDSTRREIIRTALAEFSVLGSAGREVPDLGDRGLADQVVVLLQQAVDAAEDESQLRTALDTAVRLRRALA